MQHSIPLFLESELPKNQLDHWFFISQFVGNFNNDQYELTIKIIEDTLEKNHKFIKVYQSIYGNNKVTSKMHTVEHQISQPIKFGKFYTHTGSVGESKFSKYKKATSGSLRTMTPAIINYNASLCELNLFKYLFNSKKITNLLVPRNLYEAKLIELKKKVELSMPTAHSPLIFRDGKNFNVTINFLDNLITKSIVFNSKQRIKMLSTDNVITVEKYNQYNCFAKIKQNGIEYYGKLLVIHNNNTLIFHVGHLINPPNNNSWEEYKLKKLKFNKIMKLQVDLIYVGVKDVEEKMVGYDFEESSTQTVYYFQSFYRNKLSQK